MRRLDAEHVALNLKIYVGEGPTYEWSPDTSPLDATWLARVIRYFAEAIHQGVGPKRSTLQNRPLIPTAAGVLFPAASTETPLLVPAGVDPGLLDALDLMGIERAGGPVDVLHEVQVLSAIPGSGAVWPLGACALIRAMSEKRKRWEPDLEIQTAKAVLDYLSSPGSVGDIAQRPSCADELRQFVLFPTTHGRFAAIEPETIFIPEADLPGSVSGDVELYVPGEGARWKSLFTTLGARDLDIARIISNVLLPGFSSLDADDQTATLAWIRDHVDGAITRLRKSEEPGRAVALEQALKSTPLVQDESGSLRRAVDTYDPGSRAAIQRVAGPRAPFPSASVHGDEWPRLLPFFRSLGLRKWPSARDVLARIDQLVEEAADVGVQPVSGPLLSIYAYVRENWKHLAGKKIGDTAFSVALSNRAWLPALRDPDQLSRFAAFAVPEERLYCPSELHPRRLGHLVAGRRPLQPFSKEPPTSLAQSLGFPSEASLDDVMANFDVIVGASREELSAEAVEKSLPEIYRYFGRLGDDSDLTRLKAHYEGVPCIWSRKNGAFFQASRSFLRRAGGLEPYAIMVKAVDPSVHAGFEALGMREVPEIQDYATFLESLGSPGAVLELVDTERAISALRWASQIASQEKCGLPDLLVVTEGGVLVRASAVYVPDAPWYEEKLDDGAVPLLHRRVPREVAAQTGMASLAASVTVELVERVASSDPEFSSEIRDLHDTVRSDEFGLGLRRLLVAAHEFDRGADKKWVSELSVQAVESLHTRLWLGVPHGGHRVGGGQDDYYVDEAGAAVVVYLSESSKSLAPTFLARAINRRLDAPLPDLIPLEKILSAAPGQTMGLLDRLRIPPLINEAELEFDGDPVEKVSFETEDVNGVEGYRIDPAGPDVPPVPDMITAQDARASSLPPSGRESSNLVPENGRARSDAPTSGPAPEGRDQQQTASAPRPTDRPLGEKKTWRREERKGGSVAEADRARTSATGSTSGRRRTYVRGTGEADEHEAFTHDGRERRMEVGEAAVRRVLEYESERGRRATEMGHWNEGYDIESFGADTDDVSRYIEVKGLAGQWGDTGVPLSRSQFKFGLQHPNLFWLYVVEYAEDPARAFVHAFRDPVRLVEEFRFDSGWKELASDE